MAVSITRALGVVALRLAAIASCGCANSAVTNAESGHDARNTKAAKDGGSFSDWPDGKYLSIDDVYTRTQKSDSDMQLINVVDSEFYSLGHIANSLRIPWDVLADNLTQVDVNRHIVLYCRRGVRSESAYETLTSNGYSSVWIMANGIEAWIAAGYPTVSE